VFRKLIGLSAIVLGLAAPVAATANELDNATVSAGCTGYTFTASGKYLEANDRYEVQYWFGLKLPNGKTWDVNGSLPVKSQDGNGDFNANLFEGWGPFPQGKFDLVYGRATLADDTTGKTWNNAYVTFSPECFYCQGMCSSQTQDPSNFNGTAIAPGSTIWFNSNSRG